MYLVLYLAMVSGQMYDCTTVVLKDLVSGKQHTMCYEDWLSIVDKYATTECNEHHNIVVYRSREDPRVFSVPYINGVPVKCKQ